MNLDGTDASHQFSLPRLELHAGPGGWTCVCHLPDGTSRRVLVGGAPTSAAAKRAAIEEALRTLGAAYERELRTLM